jgi:hypothetical protein
VVLWCHHCRTPSDLLGDLWVFDLDDHVWTKVASHGHVPAPRYGASMAARGTTIYLAGGKCFGGAVLEDCEGVYVADLSALGSVVWRRYEGGCGEVSTAGT